MKTQPHFLSGAMVILACIATLAVPRSAWAVVLASDNASNPAYAADATNGAWQGQNSDPDFENPAGNDNGGFGFLPWNFGGGTNSTGPVEPYYTKTHFIDGVDFPTTSYNNIGSPAFGLGDAGIPYDGDYTAATRPFANPLHVGDKFSMDIDTPHFDDSYVSGDAFPSLYIEFYDSTNAKTVGVWTAANDYYGFDYGWNYTDATHHDADVPGAASSSFAANGASLTFKLTSATTGHITLGDASVDVTLIGGVPTSIFFLMGENNSLSDGSGNPTGEHSFLFNNLKIETTGIPGDYNGDGTVNAADYVLWRKTPGSYGDAGGYTTWRANYGKPPGAGASLESAAGVPEPSTALLLLCSLVAVSLGRSVRR
jgi:hypothetical protein